MTDDLSAERMAMHELHIVGALLIEAEKAGYLCSVYDGQEWSVRHTRDYLAVRNAIRSTDENTLLFSSPFGDEMGAVSDVGSVFIVWGNGLEVISNYSDVPEIGLLVAPALDCAAALEGAGA